MNRPQTIIAPELFHEVTPLSAQDSFVVIERLKSTFDFPIHVHPECELNFIENAAGAQRIVGDSVETITGEELVLITNPTLEHAWVDHQCTSQSIYESTMQFHASLIPRALMDKNQFRSIGGLFERAQKGLAFSPRTIDRVRPLLKSISCETDGFYSVMKLMMILHELSLADDSRELASRSFVTIENRVGRDERMNRVLEYLNLNYRHNIRLSEVASLVSMSDPSFSRFIKQHTSKSFVDLLTDIRMGYVTRMLIDSSSSVTEIGFLCGFNNMSNFNRIFKQKKKMTPSEFREIYRKKKIIV
jgi:AraC-like DNA-binding protein